MTDDGITWLTIITRFCGGCQRRTKHDKGVQTKNGKQVTVVCCLACKEEITIER